MFYSNVYQQLNTKPIQTRLSFNCANIEVSIVDNQLSMIMRLIEAIISLIDQQMHSHVDENPKKERKKNLSPPPSPLPLPPPLPSLPPIQPSEDTTIESNNSQPGWVSWAWSYVPSVTTLFAEDDPAITDNNNSNDASIEPQVNKEFPPEEHTTLTTNNNNNHSPTPLLFAGIDLDRISLQYKVKNFDFNSFQLK